MMWLVPFGRLGEVERLLEEYREKYDERLEYGHERLREAITESGIAQFVKKDALREGKAYGTIGYSAGATAIRGGSSSAITEKSISTSGCGTAKSSYRKMRGAVSISRGACLNRSSS